jgi:hypothetical protein
MDIKLEGAVAVLVGVPLTVVVVITWLMGFVIAQGFWSTLFCWFPPYAWYLVIERTMIVYHILELPT